MRTLRRGSRGTDVTDLQVSLQRQGYNPGPADGKFGSRTEQTVILFQKANNLIQDGIVGPATRQRLKTKDPSYQLFTVKPKLKLTRSVAGWIPYWLQSQSFRAVQNHADVFHILSPFWYEITVTGEIIKVIGSEDSTILSFARTHGISMVPTINNSFNSELSSSLLNNSAARKNHIMNIINVVMQMDYAGIDINYENLFVKDKEVYVVFLQELKTALSAIGKKLIVTVHAKTNPFGIWSGAEAHDYRGIGQAADIVRIMGYDYHWQTSTPGSIAPSHWVDEVLLYGVSTIPNNKIVLGVPTYGYDWPVGQPGKVVSYAYALATANKFNATIIPDANLGPHFNYIADNTAHEVWFTDATFFNTLLDLVNKYSIDGICMWHPGLEDPKIYDAIRTKFK